MIPNGDRKDYVGLITYGVFADVWNGSGRIVFTDVSIDPETLQFRTRSPRVHDQVGHITPISDFGQSMRYANGLFHAGQTADEAASSIKTLVQRVIDAGIASNIGGVPSVLVLAKDQKTHWFSKAPGCPDLN
jgi:hypothetical protein